MNVVTNDYSMLSKKHSANPENKISPQQIIEASSLIVLARICP